jgi:hypothetical protein
MKDLFENEEAQALFTPDGTHRFSLWRQWDKSKETIMFIGLNPSTANGVKDDATIRRVKRFAADWGYGSIYMANLYSIVSRDPNILLTAADPLLNNDFYLRIMMREVSCVCFAWGNFKGIAKRADEVAAMFNTAVCLGTNKKGSPKHPLYVAAKTLPVKFK